MVQQNAVKYQTGCRPVDDILDGGLKRGFVLELSGPPGSCKEALAIDMARAFVEDGQGVLLVEPSLKDQNYAELVFHLSLHTLPELVIFLHKLSSYLDKYPKVVVTTQLSTKLLKEDGSPASFDTGARAVMVPQPGESPVCSHCRVSTDPASLTRP
ncbi:hypothetical protein PHLGIDRAFT_512609 [Phlebiopsis gigantea 11061_1 CR5-6]|uniref:KaiC-like domain-containing protein n=1 Tax=Phlebiopsis gigantea (strain 11061_1 CR5-6) TaxID=745531 RepID=A0A0C3RYM1_PHLG1|nr:hypothetical protein PHLGIDRAFT_512609 [Phlebiopsis gigantea 11061_1 CR5-6]